TIALPQSGPQDYTHLSQSIKQRLPKQPYILLAESFSGGIAARLSDQALPHCRGLIFAASFLTAPRPWALSLLTHLPLKFLLRLPLPRFALQYWLLGPKSSKGLISKLKDTLADISATTLKARIKTIKSARPSPDRNCLPCLCISPRQDRLVKPKYLAAFREKYDQLEVKSLDAGHFALQAQPSRCAELVRDFIRAR
ncbi:MAG: lysophospholipase, partial [Cellvibrionaceae bacterium]|nr:lysophospholipase [Cellvibrionaceae bacterium]